MIKKIIIGLVIIALIFSGLYVYSLSKIEIRSIHLDQPQNISTSKFNLTGYVEIYNGGIIPVGIDQITYDVILEANGDEIAQGNVQGVIIPPGAIVQYPIIAEINWIPSGELAMNLLSGGNTYARISGIAYVANLKIFEFKIPFQKRVDIGKYIGQYVRQFITKTETRSK